jgi:hypothetical protein
MTDLKAGLRATSLADFRFGRGGLANLDLPPLAPFGGILQYVDAELASQTRSAATRWPRMCSLLATYPTLVNFLD